MLHDTNAFYVLLRCKTCTSGSPVKCSKLGLIIWREEKGTRFFIILCSSFLRDKHF